MANSKPHNNQEQQNAEGHDAHATEAALKQAIQNLLKWVGDDPQREGLHHTPRRFLKALKFMTHGYEQKLEDVVGTALFTEETSGMVFLGDIQIFSTCEHHLLPIIGQAHVAYVPNGKILGLSKMARVCEMFARRLQVQERLTEQIADGLQTVLQPKGVAVVIEAEHMCMAMRGVQKPGSLTLTNAMRGVFETDEKMRQEFMGFVQTHLAQRRR